LLRRAGWLSFGIGRQLPIFDVIVPGLKGATLWILRPRWHPGRCDVGDGGRKNRVQGEAEIRQRLQPVFAAYRQREENLAAESRAGLAEWLLEKLQSK
jgi:hypothetical protein